MRLNSWINVVLVAGTVLAGTPSVQAETLLGALAKAYANNPDFNAARAQLRATDENVPQARAGLRPTVNAIGQGNAARTFSSRSDALPYQRTQTDSISMGIQVNQTLFDGFQTPNNVHAAEAQVKAAQQNLKNTEQNTLLDGVTIYMNVLRDRQIAALRRQNLAFLQEQVRAATARFDVGEGTRTDVAQAQSSQALATALLNSALAQVATSEASFQQIIGIVPRDLQTGKQVKGLVPPTIDVALSMSQKEHPAILATIYAVDAAAFQVKSAEGTLLPTIALTGQIADQYGLNKTVPNTTLPGVNVETQNDIQATVGATLTIPLYQGGLRSSQVRQAKETLGQRQIEVDSLRDQVRAAVATAWANLQAARANVTGYDAQVRAAKLALNGVIEERNVGQRTTLDVLNAQADVISAQILLVGSQRDEVVASYTLTSSVGRLSAERLGLKVVVYKPEDHYNAVQNKWHGTTTPDGR